MTREYVGALAGTWRHKFDRLLPKMPVSHELVIEAENEQNSPSLLRSTLVRSAATHERFLSIACERYVVGRQSHDAHRSGWRNLGATALLRIREFLASNHSPGTVHPNWDCSRSSSVSSGKLRVGKLRINTSPIFPRPFQLIIDWWSYHSTLHSELLIPSINKPQLI
jgi:hypothetical protein